MLIFRFSPQILTENQEYRKNIFLYAATRKKGDKILNAILLENAYIVRITYPDVGIEILRPEEFPGDNITRTVTTIFK